MFSVKQAFLSLFFGAFVQWEALWPPLAMLKVHWSDFPERAPQSAIGQRGACSEFCEHFA